MALGWLENHKEDGMVVGLLREPQYNNAITNRAKTIFTDSIVMGLSHSC